MSVQLPTGEVTRSRERVSLLHAGLSAVVPVLLLEDQKQLSSCSIPGARVRRAMSRAETSRPSSRRTERRLVENMFVQYARRVRVLTALSRSTRTDHERRSLAGRRLFAVIDLVGGCCRWCVAAELQKLCVVAVAV